MTDLDKIKKQVAEEQKEIYGDESVGGTTTDPEGNDTDEMFKEVVGHEPTEDDSLEKEVEKAEKENESPSE